MSSLTSIDKSKLERLFNMSEGYVLNFNDATFSTFFGDFDIDIHSEKYQQKGTSKAKKYREFWRIENDHIVGKVILEMIKYVQSYGVEETELISQCKEIGNRLVSSKVNINHLKKKVEEFDLKYIDKQIQVIEQHIESNPALAIGTSKELIESCCKTILDELKVSYNEEDLNIIKLTKLTMEKMKLLPKNIKSGAKGEKTIKQILGNLSAIAQGVAELRNLYGTGHGKSGKEEGLSSRHARLVANTSSALVYFLFETFENRTK